jgi:hypothetical protein
LHIGEMLLQHSPRILQMNFPDRAVRPSVKIVVS